MRIGKGTKSLEVLINQTNERSNQMRKRNKRRVSTFDNYCPMCLKNVCFCVPSGSGGSDGIGERDETL